jgi:transposase
VTKNVTFSLGNVALIDKIDAQTNFFDSILGGLGGRSQTFIPSVKLLINNKLDQSVSVNKILDFAPDELLETLGFERKVSNRSLYRTLERLGERQPIVLDRFQQWVKERNLVDSVQFMDFSSSYFEGKKCPLGALGYSRDGQPGKLQITFGISVGMNDIPTMLTIQKGNVQDKAHMGSLIRLCAKVLPEKSLLVFDCGGNTKANKRKIRDLKFHYLTLKAKKKGPYRNEIAIYHAKEEDRVSFSMNERNYSCVKHKDGEEYRYVFFSEEHAFDQLAKKTKKLEKELEKGEKLAKKVKRGKDLDQFIYPDGWIITRGQFQEVLGDIPNPYITGLEGFFVLESSIDDDPEKILTAYKNRDKAEKFIRDLKEGVEMRPVRHWSKHAVIGYVLIVFLTKVLVSLTQFFCENSVVKNLKVLKKYLTNLTLTIVYPPFGYCIRIISNFSPELHPILGDFVSRYGSLEVPNLW